MYVICELTTHLDHLLDLHNLPFGPEEPPPSDDRQDDPVDDLTHLQQLLHPLTLQMALQVLAIEDLYMIRKEKICVQTERNLLLLF